MLGVLDTPEISEVTLPESDGSKYTNSTYLAGLKSTQSAYDSAYVTMLVGWEPQGDSDQAGHLAATKYKP